MKLDFSHEMFKQYLHENRTDIDPDNRGWTMSYYDSIYDVLRVEAMLLGWRIEFTYFDCNVEEVLTATADVNTLQLIEYIWRTQK